ncbi:RNA-directed DNA polymerase, eukaryota [Tanacetum coccineum]
MECILKKLIIYLSVTSTFSLERLGFVFNVHGANEFNSFISNVGLVEIQLEGYSFTWSHPSAAKMSKLDRFLVLDGFLSLFPHISALCLDKNLSDHRTILLREMVTYYGATLHGFDDMVRTAWNSFVFEDSNDQGGVPDEILLSRMELTKQMQDIKSTAVRDQIQKAKIQWAVEGDENSKFFHGIVNRSRLASRHNSFAKGCNASFITLIPKSQDPKTVIDFRPISLIGSLYKVVTKILAIRLSSVISDLILDVQTAFLPGRQILDGPFIINELLSWCRHKKQQAMVFKADFAKAYDSIRWDYLDDVLFSFGFGVKWRSWIKGSLISGMASVLVNGSPTSEFQFHCGLKLTSSFLFWNRSICRFLELSRVVYSLTDSNLRSIIQMLYCFSLASGLKINLQKSNLLGVGVTGSLVNEAAASIGCSVMKAPFKYLGVMVGGNMSKINAWDDMVGKIKSRLSKWKIIPSP